MPKPQEPWDKEGASGNPTSNNCSSYVGCIVFGKLNLLKKTRVHQEHDGYPIFLTFKGMTKRVLSLNNRLPAISLSKAFSSLSKAFSSSKIHEYSDADQILGHILFSHSPANEYSDVQ